MPGRVAPYRDCPIAIVGLGGIFPGGLDPAGLWRAAVEKRWLGTEPAPGRWVLPPERIRDNSSILPDRVRSTTVCAIPAECIPADRDPPESLALLAARQALGGCKLDLIDRAKIGVILGNIFLPTRNSARRAVEVFGGQNATPAGATREDSLGPALASLAVAREFGLGGGHQTLDAACASSLYAIHLGARELMLGRMDAVLVGGVSAPDSLYTQMGFSQLRALSPSGRCRPFHTTADGLIVGQGAGMVVLKRLSDALVQGDNILALVAGAGLSNDLDGGLLAPSTEGQLRAMRSAYASGDMLAGDVDWFECHATGAPVGDLVEIKSLTELLRSAGRLPSGGLSPEQRIPVGSIKSNIGHLLTAAGGAALAKALMAFAHGRIPGMAGSEDPSGDLCNPQCPVILPAGDRVWERNPKNKRARRAALSAFGFGGINAHIVLEEYIPSGRPMVPGFGGFAPVIPPVAITATAIVPADDDKTGEIRVPPGSLRIPPVEMASMLPQQLRALAAANKLYSSTNLSGDLSGPGTAVVLQATTDPATTNYHLRWVGLSRGIAPDDPSLPPPLDANRVMGALASIAASRIARQLRLGGPCYTFASGPGGGIAQGLRTAEALLASGEVDRVIVGAVESPCDPRTHQNGQPGANTENGTVLLLVEREAQAHTKGKPILARIAGTGIDSLVQGSQETGSSGLSSTNAHPARVDEAIERTLETAFSNEMVHPGGVTLLGAHHAPAQDLAKSAQVSIKPALEDFFGPRCPESPRWWLGEIITPAYSIAKPWLSLAQTALALGSRRIPASSTRDLPPEIPGALGCWVETPWLANEADQPRAGLVVSGGAEGNTSTVLLGEVHAPLPATSVPVGEWPEALFLLEGDSLSEIEKGIGQLESIAKDNVHAHPRRLAHLWASTVAPRPSARLCLAIILRPERSLKDLLQQARLILLASPDSPGVPGPLAQDLIFRQVPLGVRAPVCLVYPGSGQAVSDMGRQLALAFPDLLEAQESFTKQLASSFVPGKFWTGNPADAASADPRQLIMGQISFGCLSTGILRALGVQPSFALGQSLGESTMMFALGAWPQRDRMLRELMRSTLFQSDVVEPWNAVRQIWNLPEGSKVDWIQALFPVPLEQIQRASTNLVRVYPLIELAPAMNLVGGDGSSIDMLAKTLGIEPIRIPGGTAVHGPMANPIAGAWRQLHYGPVSLPPGLRLFLAGCPAAVPPISDIVAEAFVEAATSPISMVELVRRAYAAGARFFLEVGPGASCTPLVRSILGDNSHAVVSLAPRPGDERAGFLVAIGTLLAERIPLDREALGRLLFCEEPEECTPSPDRDQVIRREIPKPLLLEIGLDNPDLNPVADAPIPPPEVLPDPDKLVIPATTIEIPRPAAETPYYQAPLSDPAFMETMQDPDHPLFRAIEISGLEHDAQSAYLRFAAAGSSLLERIHAETLAGNLSVDDTVLEYLPVLHEEIDLAEVRRSLTRNQCMHFAIGSVAQALGSRYSEADSYPTRVRLPDQPLMLVDRVLSIEGEPFSLKSGRVITEHDVLPGGWYLDNDRMPISLTVEAGQADMLLAGWLGIDFQTKGLAVYRLLDATIIFEDYLPRPGEVMTYDIRVLRFFRHGDSWLFRFEYDGYCAGKPVLRMRDGCAGFFTPATLAAGQGLLPQDFPPRKPPEPGTPTETVSKPQMDALRRGDLVGAFGSQFAGHPVARPATLPSGRLELIHRAVELDVRGGSQGLGRIVTECDIHPDDWFITCHFIDDMVMPGTLMYEACLQSLRVLLMRKGWIAPEGMVTIEGRPGLESALKCRGQVTTTTKITAYELEIVEIKEGPNPSVIAHAVMFADGKPVVSCRSMSLLLRGADSRDFYPLGTASTDFPMAKNGLLPLIANDPNLEMDHTRLLEFCTGSPSKAFGSRFLPFDHDRTMARLPRPPYLLMDEVVWAKGEAQTQTAPKECLTRFRVDPKAWWATAGGHGRIPFAILLEIALQPCGWISAWSGAALTSEEDLSYRNLGGNATLHADPLVTAGVIEVHAKLDRVSRSGGMILHFFTFDVQMGGKTIYDGTTYFGFFTKAALANQVGITETKPWAPVTPVKASLSVNDPRLPRQPLLMLDAIEEFDPKGGPKGLGYARATKKVNPAEWFFEAHFYQDPVMPGSLGLEAFAQLAGLLVDPQGHKKAVLLHGAPTHTWIYRGQVIPKHHTITTKVEITSQSADRITADGWVEVDGRIIYQMKDFTFGLV